MLDKVLEHLKIEEKILEETLGMNTFVHVDIHTDGSGSVYYDCYSMENRGRGTCIAFDDIGELMKWIERRSDSLDNERET